MFPACFDGLCPEPPTEAKCFAGVAQRVIDGYVQCLDWGHLYRAGDVVRLGGPDSHEFLFLDKRGQLCAEFDYECHTCTEFALACQTEFQNPDWCASFAEECQTDGENPD